MDHTFSGAKSKQTKLSGPAEQLDDQLVVCQLLDTIASFIVVGR